MYVSTKQKPLNEQKIIMILPLKHRLRGQGRLGPGQIFMQIFSLQMYLDSLELKRSLLAGIAASLKTKS